MWSSFSAHTISAQEMGAFQIWRTIAFAPILIADMKTLNFVIRYWNIDRISYGVSLNIRLLKIDFKKISFELSILHTINIASYVTNIE